MNGQPVADLAVKKIRSHPIRRSLPQVLFSDTTGPQTARRSFPSNENAAWSSQDATWLHRRSFSAREGSGSLGEACRDLETATDSFLSNNHTLPRSGRLSLTITSNTELRNSVHLRSSTAQPLAYARIDQFITATSRRPFCPRTPSPTSGVSQRQFDGTSDDDEQEEHSIDQGLDDEQDVTFPEAECQISDLGSCEFSLPVSPFAPQGEPQEHPCRRLESDPAGRGQYSFVSSSAQSSKSLTAATRRTPTRNSFPFPRVGCEQGSLIPFSSRLPGSPLRPSQHSPASSSRSASTTPGQSPDRFIAPRGSDVAARDSFQVSASSSKLSPNEKLRRSRDTNLDPFALRDRRASTGTFATHLPAPAIGSRQNSNVPPPSGGPLNVRRLSLSNSARRISNGAIWSVGGAAASAETVVGVTNGRGGLFASGSSAPLYRSNFLDRLDSVAEREALERRLALALDVDISARVLNYVAGKSCRPTLTSPPSLNRAKAFGPTVWKDSSWTKEGSTAPPKKSSRTKRAIPTIPFRVLDAPSLRDDFYCSLLAYSESATCLAVGLGSHVYLWSEGQGVDTPDSLNVPYHAYVTCLSFSSVQGEKSILGIGRACGRLLLWSPYEEVPRLTSIHPSPVCCISFRPTTVRRPSRRDHYLVADTEELILGDELGHIYFYSVEWPTQDQYDLFGFPGDLYLLCRITVHMQQICGLAWSHDGEFFASGGNDNECHLFETRRVLQHASTGLDSSTSADSTTSGLRTVNIDTSGPSFKLGAFVAKHKWTILAAVKAIAFCPWQRGLIAIGGGSNDRRIHFYHTLSGACLATIDCSAQVTSLIWSTTRREIAATFGFAQPEHPYRIAVFSWPKCEVVVRIPWFEEHRALFAILYPGGPNNGQSKGEGGMWRSRTQEEGCIAVATSDASIKFHEVWAEERKSVGSKGGLLGGSDILESLHGIDKEQPEVIR